MDMDKPLEMISGELYNKIYRLRREWEKRLSAPTVIEITNNLLSLLAPVFEKAGKYEKAAKGLKAVEDLMNNSEGVMGLHLNGDIAPWSELRTEGRFEEWLVAFDEAISEVPDGN